LAAGPELKNTFCLTKEGYAFISHHVGDMENYETLKSYEEGIRHFEKLFRIEPQVIACDLHPNYLGTRYALNRAQSQELPLYQIQHHHAHIAACMADNALPGDRPVIGVSMDGTGYGDDGNIWGGEILISDYLGYKRFAHLAYSPLPGGDMATKKPYRLALAQLWKYEIDWDDDLPAVNAACGDDLSMLRAMLENKINTPDNSSMGRLFDAVAALVGVRGEANYEAQAAIEFEALADPTEERSYPFDIIVPEIFTKVDVSSSLEISPLPMFVELVNDLRTNISIPTVSAKFHNGVANLVAEICNMARKTHGINEVALSGGVWQNMILLRKTIILLEQSGFTIYIHRQIPPNDGGLALGQAVIAAQAYLG
jgi:hydrogenase maturation protein HypF